MVFKAGATVAVAAVAVYNSVQGRAAGALSAHNGVDSLGGFGTAGGALIGGCAVFNNRFCIVSTAGIAAAAAIGACKAFGDLRNARVFVHSHKLGSQHQNNAARQAQNNKHDDGEGNTIHRFLPLTSVRR